MRNQRNKVKLIYILGNSYSGSTILSYLIGSSSEIIFVGEIKNFSNAQKNKNAYCTCGLNHFKCKYWKDLYKKNYSIFEKPSLFERLVIILGIIFKSINIEKPNKFREIELIRDICRVRKKQNQKCQVLDSSKSLWRLISLLKCKELQVKIIYIKKDFKDNVASFVDHGNSFLMSVIICKLNNYLTNKFLTDNDLNYLSIDYKDFCCNNDYVMDRIGCFIGVKYSDYNKMIERKDYHVVTGNSGTINQIKGKIRKIQYKTKFDRLTSFQKAILNILCK